MCVVYIVLWLIAVFWLLRLLSQCGYNTTYYVILFKTILVFRWKLLSSTVCISDKIQHSDITKWQVKTIMGFYFLHFASHVVIHGVINTFPKKEKKYYLQIYILFKIVQRQHNKCSYWYTNYNFKCNTTASLN